MKRRARPATGGVEAVNEVRLLGRLSRRPEVRELPSGDTVWNFRVVVRARAGQGQARQRVDALECAVWSGRVKTHRSRSWVAGDVVEVTGALRRRFFRAGGATGLGSRWS